MNLGSGLRPYFGTIEGIPLSFFLFVWVFFRFPQVREFSAAPHQRSEYSGPRVVKQWKVTGYLNQRIILAPDKSLRRVQLQYKHRDVCQSAPHQPPLTLTPGLIQHLTIWHFNKTHDEIQSS